ncbi:Gcn1p [Saccharomyces cerevisiae x Saccharomyces kudriavzevii VIN7]|uniref:eIF-2-alpha kinase activator GCN1 n=1 Tax=Saccharomyces cerevisiae x Saccharomyces kudriavzevii (strain VIN7) TaxID=1095631 RepID=H0GUK0_SACCK|nr:Gcn1p [Saccharomyces cerevisiae x Saccharomyces kudriavzevii VIN7]
MTAVLNWEEISPVLEKGARESLVSKRVPFLQSISELVRQETLEKPQLSEIASCLLNTFVLYEDNSSKSLVTSILLDILNLEPCLLESFVQFISDVVISNPATKAVADYLNLLDWINSFLVFVSRNSMLFEEYLPKLLVAHSYATFGVETILDNQEDSKKPKDKQNQHRKRIRQCIFQSTVKTMLKCLKDNDDGMFCMQTVTKSVLEDHSKLKMTSVGVVLIMGALTQTALQLLSRQPALQSALKESSVEKYCEYLGKEVLLGKNSPSPFCLEVSLKPFLKEFVSQSLFTKFFVPNIEKAILRSPEVGFSILSELYAGVSPGKINLLNVFTSSKLLNQSFSALKSSKDVVRAISLHSVKILFRKISKSDTNSEDLMKVVDEIFRNIKSNLNADYKSMISKILIEIPLTHREVSEKICKNLCPYIGKEGNEVALTSMLNAFFIHYFSLEGPVEDLNKIISAGFTDKKPPLKKCWFATFLNNSDSASEEVFLNFLDGCFEFAKDSIMHYQTHGHTCILASIQFINKILTLNNTQLNGRAIQLIDALPENTTIGDAILTSTLSTELSIENRIHAVVLLQELFHKKPEIIGFSVIDAIERRMRAQELIPQQNTSFKYITTVLLTITSELPDKEALINVLIDALVIAQWDIFNVKNGWAGLVLRAKLDPAEVVKKHADAIMDKILEITNNNEWIDTIYGSCGLQAAAYAAFIQPSEFTPILCKTIEADLSTNDLSQLSEEDFNIFAGEEGILVVDVLEESMNKKLSNKNSREYETLIWEQKIRKEQAKKSVKRLSKEEQELVDRQLAKESKIRLHVSEIFTRLKRGIKLIFVLSKAACLVQNGITIWFPLAVTKFLHLCSENNILKLTEDVNKVFLQLSKNVSERLGNIRLFLGLATLRVHNAKNISENYLQEPLVELLTRVLFRIKFVSDQAELDPISLTYILPLLINVLEKGKAAALKNADKPVVKAEFVEEDEEEEHLLLAMEIISVHASAFEDPSIPRISIIEVLLSLLSLPSKAKIAKECFNALCQSISVAPNQEDLDIILSNLLSPNQFVRSTILEILDNEFELEPFMKFSPEIFICRFDSDPSNRDVADFIWEFNKFEINDELLKSLFSLFNQDDSGLRLFAANAYAFGSVSLFTSEGSSSNTYLDALMSFYKQKAKPLEAILDQFGLVLVSASEQKDPWQGRSTVAITLKIMAKALSAEENTVVSVIKFLVDDGGLVDREPIVRQEMKEAGVELITLHGSQNSEELIPIFEEALSSSRDSALKENVIILYGTLARHLQERDPRIHTIIERLLSTLDTPSADIQQAVSACIAPLVFQFKPKVGEYLNLLMEKLLNPTVAVSMRKGAAWGIAGLVKGYGISALSEFDIIRNLIEAAEDKKEPKRRESVGFSFQYLSQSLEKFFEPYVIEILPNILKNLGDAVPEVREATAHATKAIMAHTTGYGVKKLIPVAVSNLDEIAWRTKRGSVQLLGNMAYLDPTQLSASLSTIVPEIVGVLNDSHKEVRKAADESLKRFGEVIRNPEIQKLVPILLQAIGDPTRYTEEALDSLIQTQFVHYIDGPSLALIIHIIHRGMHDRSANVKRKACKIVGNMAILVDTKDLVPYLQQLIDEVEIAMVDPVPNTRATAARALGALVERLGEEQFPDLIPRLLDTLSDEFKSGDRLGSAQALAEVISGLGLTKLDEMLPTILAGVTNFRAYIREGFMPLLLFLPVCFGSQFASYINQIIQPILSGLADNDENIRDTALKAGKLIVKNYATKAVDLLLPELERGMFDENERIRLSSVQLTGELLFQVTGISSKNEFSEEDGDHNGEFSGKLVDVLGQDRRDRILAALFVCRNDISGIVRATTVDIWKALVPNTPRAVKEILPTLTGMIVTYLASSSSVLRNIAAQTLGDLVRRVGGNALSQLLPSLEESLIETSNPDSRQGVCIALYELIESASAETISQFQSIIVNIIRTALIDESATVRQAAALSFDVFQDVVGKTAVDEVLPYLLHMLESSDNSGFALLGLQEIMSKKSDVIFPILIPTLLAPPIDAFRASALGSLAEVAGSALYRRLSIIINTLVDAITTASNDESTKTALEVALNRIFLSVADDEGLHPLLQQIMSLLKNDNVEKRIAVLERLPNFFDKTTLDFDVYINDFVSHAILSLDDEDSRVVNGNFNALSTLLKKVDKPTLEKLVKPAKQSLALTGKQGEDLAAFRLPKGPNCVLPIFLHGLMYGSNDEREESALAIADVVSKTPAANLKPFVSVITGPLIRVIGERFSSDIKAAILFALNVLFIKIPMFLRPFIPQLQRTFVKSLSDATNETLRLRAARALGALIEHQPRVDPLVIELVTGAKQATDEGVKTAMLKALLEVIVKAGSKLNEGSKTNIVNLVEEEMLGSNDKLAVAYAKLIGSLSEILSHDEAHKILQDRVLNADLDGETGMFAILTLNSFLKDAPIHIFNTGLTNEIVSYILKAFHSPDAYFGENGVIAAGKLLLLEGERKSPFVRTEAAEPFDIGDENINLLISELSKAILQPASNSTDVRRLSLVVIRTLARFKFDECLKQYYDVVGPSVFACLRDPVIPIKLAAEKAYLALFKLVEEDDMNTFNEWFSRASDGADRIETITGTSIQLRSIGDYTKRVGKRLANVERERIAAGGDAETMYSDRFEDEREIWAVGGVELTTDI